MRTNHPPLILGGSFCALGLVAALAPKPVRSATPEGISLLKTLEEWKYPGSSHFDGPSMSDAGVPPMQAVKCAAVLTTPDPIDKVVAFYAEKLEEADSRPLSVLDVSEDRPVTIRVFVVNRPDASTTLVISRAESEKATHIAW